MENCKAETHFAPLPLYSWATRFQSLNPDASYRPRSKSFQSGCLFDFEKRVWSIANKFHLLRQQFPSSWMIESVHLQAAPGDAAVDLGIASCLKYLLLLSSNCSCSYFKLDAGWFPPQDQLSAEKISSESPYIIKRDRLHMSRHPLLSWFVWMLLDHISICK